MSVDFNLRIPQRHEDYERPKVSVCIPVCNEWPQVVLSIFTATEELVYWGYPFEIVLACNGCIDGSYELLRWRFARLVDEGRLKVLNSDYPSCDMAWFDSSNAASGDFLFFLDAHVSVGVGTIHGMVQSALKRDALWIPAITILNFTERPENLCRGWYFNWETFTAAPRAPSMLPSWAHRSGRLFPHTIPTGTMCSMLGSRETIMKKAGGFGDFWPKFSYSGNEPCFFIKSWLMGIETWIHPDLYTRHDQCGLVAVKPEGQVGWTCRKGGCRSTEGQWEANLAGSFVCGGPDLLCDRVQKLWAAHNFSKELRPQLYEMIRRIEEKAAACREFVRQKQVVSYKALLVDKPWDDPRAV